MSELFNAIMKNVGTGFGSDYMNLSVRLKGTVAYIEGSSNNPGAIEAYADAVRSTEGVTDVIIDAVISGNG